jgi:hypothetical protein
LTSTTTQIGTAWTGTAPGPGNPTVSGTITTDLALTDHIRQVSVGLKAAMQDFTTFGDGGYTVVKPGLLGADLSIEFNYDTAAANVEATFAAGVSAKTLYYIDVKSTSAARGSTNASYVFAAYVAGFPVTFTVGERAMTTVEFAVTGSFARLTS